MNKINFSANNYSPENINEDTNYNINSNELNKGGAPELDNEQPLSSNERRQNRNKRRNEKKLEEKKKTGIIQYLSDRRTLYFLGILLISLTAYIAITSISHIKNGDIDQSIILNNTITNAANNTNSTQNIGGPLGAFISYLTLSQWLGFGAFVLTIYLGYIGYSLLRSKKIKFWSITFKCLILAISTSIILGFVTYNTNLPTYIGGQHGYFINDLLIKTTGLFGAIIVNIIIVSLVAFIFINDINKIYTKYRNTISSHITDDSTNDGYIDEYDSKANNNSQKRPSTLNYTIESNSQNGNTSEKNNKTTLNEDKQDNEPGFKLDIINNIEDCTNVNSDVPEVSLTINTSKIEIAEDINTDVYDPTAELSRYKFPTIDLLINRIVKENSVDKQEQEENKERITKALNDHKIEISHIEATVGPTVTLYEIIPAEGIKISRIKSLEDDIALSLAALGIRIIAPIPGKGTIGIEVPNKDPQTVSMHSMIASKKYQETSADLPMAVGVTISNEVFIADLTRMPHLLVAGATGMGKSVGLNAIIASLLYKKHPAELKFVLIDPKMVEFSLYRKLERHYLAKLPDEENAVITDPSKVVTTLNSLCIEMDNRYALLTSADVRSIKEYNAKFTKHKLNPEKGHRYLPYIVVIVDEFADLIMTAGKEIETPIARIAQKARAVGIHMILATQRPSTNVVTGLIKANFPGRIAFRVNQMVDSRTIIDRPGANQLIGNGDMLFSRDGIVDRLQCAFISTDEVVAICNHIDDQIGYEHAYYLPEYTPDSNDIIATGSITERDTLFEEAARFIVTSQTASTSSLQRRYSIGYNRAGKIMDQMESAGIVGPAQGGKPRQVLVDSIQIEQILESL